jgi:cytochrome c553
MKQHLLLGILCAFCLSFTGCTYDKYEKLHPLVAIQDTIKRAVSYKSDVVPIMASYCYRCHGDDATNGGQFHLNSYSTLSNWTTPNDSSCQLIKSITKTNTSAALFMPNDGTSLPQADISTIVKWVQQGAKDN